jgi:hypothetical protein
MLGIKALSDNQIAHFRNSDVGDDAPRRASSAEDAAFGALQDRYRWRAKPTSLLDNELPIASNPSRLAPFAAAITSRFLDFEPDRRLRRSWSAWSGQAAGGPDCGLGPAEFATVQDLLSDLAGKDNSIRDNYPLLYLRLADAGPQNVFALS